MSVTRVPERYVPSVEDAAGRLAWARWMALVFPNDHESHRVLEAVSVLYDLAVSVAHPARREPAWLTQVEDVAWA